MPKFAVQECEVCGQQATGKRHGLPTCDVCASQSDAIDAFEDKKQDDREDHDDLGMSIIDGIMGRDTPESFEKRVKEHLEMQVKAKKQFDDSLTTMRGIQTQLNGLVPLLPMAQETEVVGRVNSLLHAMKTLVSELLVGTEEVEL